MIDARQAHFGFGRNAAQARQINFAHQSGGIAFDATWIICMVNAVEQRFDCIGQRRGIKPQQHLNRLGEFYELDLVDGIFHALVEAVTVSRA